MRNFLPALLLLLTFGTGDAFASHILAGGFTYQFIDSTGGHYHYRIRLTEYVDCLTGQPEAIAADNPAFFGIYDGGGTLAVMDSSVDLSSFSSVSVDYSTPCGTFSTPVSTFCASKRIFEKDFYLTPNTTGYTVAYQRCCRSASVVNLVNPGDVGITYFCNIPPMQVANTSAVFTKDPPLVVCLDNTLVYDLSATDANSDSLSYELHQCYSGANEIDIKPLPAAPPYDPVNFVPSSSFTNPMGSGATFSVNPVTGWLTIHPS